MVAQGRFLFHAFFSADWLGRGRFEATFSVELRLYPTRESGRVLFILAFLEQRTAQDRHGSSKGAILGAEAWEIFQRSKLGEEIDVSSAAGTLPQQ